MKKSGLTNQPSPQWSAKAPSILKPGATAPSHKKPTTNQASATQAPTPKVIFSQGDKMTVKDASRIYRTTATQGNGKIPSGSFGARAMSAAMLTEKKPAKPHK